MALTQWQLNPVATDTIASGDFVAFSDEGETGDPVNKLTVDNLMETGLSLVTEDAIAVGSDYILFLDGGATGNANKEQFSDVMTAVAGTGISASSGVLNVDADQSQITHVGALQAGSITSGFTSIDVGSGAISTTGVITTGSVAYTGNLYFTGTLATASNTNNYMVWFNEADSSVVATATNSGTGAAGYGFVVIDGEAIAAASSYTFAESSSLMITGPPTAGTNMTLTDAYALNVVAGNSKFGGNVTASGFTADADGAVTLANEGKVKFTDTTFADGNQRSAGITLRFTTSSLAIAIGQAVHLSGTGVILADADVASQGAIPCIGVAASATTGTGTENIDVLVLGCMRYDTYDFTAGSGVFVTATPGGLDETAPSTTGHYVQKVGIAMSADILYVNPSLDVIEHA